MAKEKNELEQIAIGALKEKDKFEKALSDAVRAIENVSKTILEYFKNLKRYKPMKMRKRRNRAWQNEEENL